MLLYYITYKKSILFFCFLSVFTQFSLLHKKYHHLFPHHLKQFPYFVQKFAKFFAVIFLTYLSEK